MLFKIFVGDKNGNQKQDKWPGHKKVRAPKIQYQISRKNSSGGERNPGTAHFWYVNILQFAFGGVFSSDLVLYFRSADFFVAWPFILLLVAIFIANEFLKKHYVRLSFQISLFFLSIYWFAIFLVPVVMHRIGTWVFLFSGLVSLLVIALFNLILLKTNLPKVKN